MIENIRKAQKERMQYFLYGKQDIARVNLRVLTEISFFAAVVTCFLILFTPMIFPDWVPTIYHLLLVPLSSVFCIIAMILRRRNYTRIVVINFLCMGYVACILTLLIGIDVLQSAEHPASFMQAVFIIIPAIFVFRFPVIYTELMFFEVIYVVLLYQRKILPMARNDCFNSIVGIVLSLVVAHVIQLLRAEAYNSKNEYKHRSMFDGLTGILNKENCEAAAREYINGRLETEGCALLIMDVDDFKKVNDCRGHQVGDEVLSSIGIMMLNVFRGSDIFGRFGGDEFLILMKDASDTELIEKKCRRLIDCFGHQSQKFSCSLSCSIGAAVLLNQKGTYEDILRQADKALYEAKAAGKAQFVIRETYEFG